MRSRLSNIVVALWLGSCAPLWAALTPDQIKQLPPPATHEIDFTKEIKPIFEESCIKCHGRGRAKGGLQIDSRESIIKGGDTGPAVVPGKSADSLIIELVQGFDPDSVMPKKGTKLTPDQIGLLRAWIDQGMKWDANVTFGRIAPNNLTPRRPEIPAGPKDANPIDRFLQPYYAAHHVKLPEIVDDRRFARRVYLDVTGLLPSPEALKTFLDDHHADKRARLVRALLVDNSDYAQKWMSFWNDLLRNDYRGTGYIDGGRKQITGWLYSVLATNMPYDKFVAQLINPTEASEGFTKGIVWRGVVNASQTPQMQTAQNISQVFMGVNLKCASCHDSFINDLMLSDAYGMAGIYADKALEMVYCDKPTGKVADLKFLYPELGTIDPKADRPTRLRRLAEIITEKQDARLTRTIVNRFWQKFMGRGLVEPVDEMEKPAWNQDLLDWLAADLADHDYDLKHLIETILTSKAYQLPAVNFDEKSSEEYVFQGPQVRRLSAEEFRDAISEVTGAWYEHPDAQINFSAGAKDHKAAAPADAQWIWNDPKAATSGVGAETVYFRKEFKLLETPDYAQLIVGADDGFTIYVNGKKIGAATNYATLKVFDVRKSLEKGENAIAVTAVNIGTNANAAGLFVYACIRRDAEGKPPVIMDFGTDKTWTFSSEAPKGWEKAGFEGKWAEASPLGPISMAPWKMESQFTAALSAPDHFGKIRAVLVSADPLQVALGRPNREQVVTTRLSAATTLEALELTNGHELADLIARGAKTALADSAHDPGSLVPHLYAVALGRKPTSQELKLANEIVGKPAQAAGVEDLLWAMTMLPEFQLIF